MFCKSIKMIYNHRDKTIFGKKRIAWVSLLFSGFLLFICVGTVVSFIILSVHSKEKLKLAQKDHNPKFIPTTPHPSKEDFQETTTARRNPENQETINSFHSHQNTLQFYNIGSYNISNNNGGILLTPTWQLNEVLFNSQIINLNNLNNMTNWQPNKPIQINVFVVKLNSSSDINIFMNIV